MRVGVWLIGALGDVATTAVVGARAIARGLAPRTALVSETAPCEGLELAPFEALVFGGHDVREGTPQEAAARLAAEGVIPYALPAALAADLADYAARIRPGCALGGGRVVQGHESSAAREVSERGPAAVLEQLRADLSAFRREHQLERVVVVAVASTEPQLEPPPAWATRAGIEAAIAAADPALPASLLYAWAAIAEGCPYVNFTPSTGATPEGAQAFARERGVPVAGNDGKTGETLLRTTLAPMFRARNLDVRSWAGFNILGNRDGEVLDEPGANAAKTGGKDKVLGAILGPGLGSSLTRIDYVPSLRDWKTAWDHVHFAGFLGTQMTLQFTWQGADSALAAPLVLDLVRLLELAARRERSGAQSGLACFFKAPLGSDEHDFFAQSQAFAEFAASLRG